MVLLNIERSFSAAENTTLTAGQLKLADNQAIDVR